MENVSLSAITIGSKYLAISGSRLEDTLIHTNQASASIDRRGQGDWEIYFRIQKSCNKINIDFRRNTNCGIGVNSPRTTGSIIPYISIMKSGNEMQKIGFGRNSGDGIPPK